MKARKAIGIGGILGVFITAIIAIVLAGPFRTQVINGVNQTGASMENYTGGAGAIAQQLPLFFILLVVAIMVAPVAREFARVD